MNRLKMDKQVSILKALVEGNSVRSTERMTDVHRDTILRLLVRVGERCENIMNREMRGFHSHFLQADEIWTFVLKKEGRLNEQEKENPGIGDQYVFVALDAESKLVPTFTVGKRDGKTALKFMNDLKSKLIGNGRIQLTTDGFKPYINAVEWTFGSDIDFAQQIKCYDSENPGRGRYSPPRVSEVVSKKINGSPDMKHISTSFVERQNLTMRMQMRRFTRLTNAFSKKLENLKAALALHFYHYNFMRVHRTLRVTPAMEAGITHCIWTWGNIL